MTEMTLLGRVGDTLTRFVGSGYIRVVNGVAKLEDNAKLTVTKLYHKWIKTKDSVNAVVGDPQNAPFLAIVDNSGTAYATRGLYDKDSLLVWDYAAKVWTHKAASDFPIQVLSEIPKSPCIELTGFNPSVECSETPRPLVALRGNGLVTLSQSFTDENGCDACGDCPEDRVASKATVSTFPTDDGKYYLRYDPSVGLFYELKNEIADGKSAYEIAVENGFVGSEAAWLASLEGADGADGVDGADGADGEDAYAVWLSLGNVGSKQDFIDSLKGQDGADGADGANLTGELALTTTTIDKGYTFFAPLTASVNANVNASANLAANTRADTGWSSVPGSGSFVFTGQADRTEIKANVLLKISDTDTSGAQDVAPTFELYRNGVLVATAVAEQEQENDNTESSATLVYTDANPAASGVYELRTRQESSVATAVPIQSGWVSATAYIETTVVTNVEFVVV